MRRLLELQRRVRELKQEFAPSPSPPDFAQALIGDLWSAWILTVLSNSHAWKRSCDGPEEIVRLLGIPQFFEGDWNAPGVKDCACKLFCEHIQRKLRAIVKSRGANWPDDKPIDFFNDEVVSLYSEIPVELKKRYGLPGDFVEFYFRAEALPQ